MNSFIVPAHNEQRGIGRALQAIHAAAQVIGRPYEIIVVDDSSTDETASVAHEHNATVLPVRHRQIAATRNSGAGAAQGKRFFFVDADTIISPGVLASALRSLDKGAAGGGAPARFEADAPLYARLLLLWLGLSMRVAGISGGTPPQQTPTCPCGNRQMSGCPHDCQTSSILSFKQIKSWIPSINKILFLGVAGRVVVKFIAVRFILSHISRALCNLPRIGLFYGPESGTKLEIEGFTPSSEEDKSSHFDQVGPATSRTSESRCCSAVTSRSETTPRRRVLRSSTRQWRSSTLGAVIP